MDKPGLEDRFASIERRLSRIENLARLPAPTPEFRPQARPTPTAQSQQLPAEETITKPGNWLGIIAVICFVFAAGFIIKLSIDSGWLTPERQIGLAAFLGFSLIGAGFLLLKEDRSYATLLPSAGIIILDLTVFAAHRYYALIPFETAIVLTSLVSALCIWLYTRIRHDAYAVTAAVGAYLAPPILALHAESAFSLYYFLLCSLTFASISIWVKSRTLPFVASYLAILMTGSIGIRLGDNLMAADMLALHFLIFSVGTYFYSTQTRTTLTKNESWGFFPVLLLFYSMEYYLLDQVYPGLAPWISLGFAAVLIGLYLSARTYFRADLGSQSLIVTFATVVFFHSFYLELLPDNVHPWLFPFIMLGIAFAPEAFFSRKKDSFTVVTFAVFAVLIIEYIRIIFHLLVNYDTFGTLIVTLAAFISIWQVLFVARNNISAETDNGRGLLAAAHVLAVLGLYRLTHDVSSLAVSASWLMYAVGIIIFAFQRRDKILVQSALFILAFAGGKALLYDAASAPTVIRIFCLLLTGGVLYICGLFVRKTSEWSSLNKSH